ncbi:MAG: putative Ribosomal RNA small subunit methyltransferase [Streblomastix strix]|uniref:rRNA adenine N(6)-methyltransferase n=1 Tax=Streblomastix strix TaxID=222440 RepID=A0A5J4VT94_9EUKA|nr:MAG: putative Ribosomal RNA small subunit methyltransferase [Streblomastix strix]
MPKNSGFKQGIVLQRTKGQHLLINPKIIDGIVEKSGIRGNDICLEIGPGTGNLTVKLLERCSKVIAVELDPRMAIELKKRVSGTELDKKLELIQGDVLKVRLPFFTIVVANIPYSISSPLIFRLLSIRPMFRCAVLMLQAEFAQRLVAKPNTPPYCRLTVNTGLLANVAHLMKVGKGNFRPPPQVDSAVVRIEPRQPEIQVPYDEWDGLTRICFQRKNKTLGALFGNNNVVQMMEKNKKTFDALHHIIDEKQQILSSAVPGAEGITTKQQILSLLQSSDFNQKRANKMDLDDFLRLLQLFNEQGFHFTT